ncbi:MAG: hypothetical protein ACK46X_11855 [Candidatus Sericytochromatia bacterium]
MPVQSYLETALDKAYETKPLTEILAASPAALAGVSDKDAELLKQAFGIKSIQDMATNKFFLTAQALVNLAAVKK